MTITFGWDGSHYLIELYVSGYTVVNVKAAMLYQLINLINLMKSMYPISIAFDPTIDPRIKTRITEAIKRNITL